MSKNEIIERSRKAIREFNQLPPAQQAKELIAFGTISPNGEVLLGQHRNATRTQDARDEKSRS